MSFYKDRKGDLIAMTYCHSDSCTDSCEIAPKLGLSLVPLQGCWRWTLDQEL